MSSSLTGASSFAILLRKPRNCVCVSGFLVTGGIVTSAFKTRFGRAVGGAVGAR